MPPGPSLSDDGRGILSESEDGSLRCWPAPEAWAQELCAKLTRNLSPDPWQQWVSADVACESQCPGLPIAFDGIDPNAAPGMGPGEPAGPAG